MKSFFTLLFFLIPFCSNAQESANQKKEREHLIGGLGNLNFSKSAYGKYYSGGGLGNLSISSLLDIYSTRNNADREKTTFDTNLRINYGVVKIEETNGENFTKSSDEVDFIAKYGKPIRNSASWQYSSALNISTQLTDTRTAFNEETGEFSSLIGVNNEGFGKIQSTFLAPADISIGIGAEFKPEDSFSVFIGPLTSKIRLVLDDNIAKSGLMGNDVLLGENNEVIDFNNYRFETGANIISTFNKKFLADDMFHVKSDLKLFSNYLDKPENIDISWNTFFSLNPWKFITVNYTANIQYDDDKQFTAYANGQDIEGSPQQGIQFRSLLGIGITHKINKNLEKKKIETEKLFFTAEKI